MGKKVHPKIFRLGHTTQWLSKWFTDKNFSYFLKQDILVRDFLFKKLKKSGIDKVEIERYTNKVKINILTSRPGVIIGRGGEGIEKLKKELIKIFFKQKEVLELNVQEVKTPFLAAGVVLENIILDLEKRVPYRRAMKQTIEQVRRAGAKGVKVILSGRLDGVEIARQETLFWGKVPLHTMRADIDYAQHFAQTIYGSIGVKIWIYRGEVFADKIGSN